jgi:hypothetical protein
MAVSTNLIAYWKLDNSIGDATGNHSFTEYNGTFATNGIKRQSMKFNKASSQYARLSSATNTAFNTDLSTNDFTFSAWVYIDNASTSSRGIMGNWGTEPYVYTDLGHDGTDKPYFKLGWTETSYTEIYGDANILPNRWNHLVFIADRDTSMYMYVNNVRQTSWKNINASSGYSMYSATNRLNIGNIGTELGGYFFDGYIDEVGAWNRALTADDVSTIYNGRYALSYPFTLEDLSTGLQSYWKLDEDTGTTIYDAVGVNHLTLSGAVVGSTDAISIKSIDFDTSTDYLQDLTLSGLDTSNSQFSISFWAKFDTLAVAAGHPMILARFQSTDGPGSNSPTGVISMVDAGGYNAIQTNTYTTDGSYYEIYSGTSKITFATAQWYHIVYMYSYDVSLRALYVNAADAKQTSNNKISFYPADRPNYYICIGNSYGGATRAIDGRIDEVGYWSRLLTPTEVATLYNNGAGFAFPFVTAEASTDLSTNLKAYWKLDETSDVSAHDSLNTYDLIKGTGITQNQSGKIVNSYAFTAGNTGLSKPSTAYFAYPEVTFSCWVKSASVGGSARLSIAADWSGTDNDGWWFYIAETTGKPTIYLGHTGYAGGDSTLTANASIGLSTWTHLAFSFKQPNQRLYINGAEASSATWDTSILYVAGGQFYIGRGDSYRFNGYIDEVGIWDRELATSEISQLYNSGSGLSFPFTGGGDTPSALLSDLISYWKMEETTGTTLYDSHGNNDITTWHNPSLNTTGKILQAVDFDPSSSGSGIMSGDFATLYADVSDKMSVSFWIKEHKIANVAPTGDQYMFRCGYSTTPWYNCEVFARSYTDGIVAAFRDKDTSSFSVAHSSALSTETWYHIVAIAGGVGTYPVIYVNNVSTAGSTLQYQRLLTANSFFGVGSSYDGANEACRGIMDEVGWWSRALTNGEVASLYNNGNGLAYPFSGGGTSTLLQNIISYWPLNETDGSAADSLSIHTGSCVDISYNSTSGKLAGCYKFKNGGSTSRVTVGNIQPTTFSYSFWLKTASASTNDMFLIDNTDYSSNWYGYRIYIGSGGMVSFITCDGASHIPEVTGTAHSVVDNNWHHVVAVADSSANTIGVYVDTSYYSYSTTYDVSYFSGCITSFGQNGNNQYMYNGQLDEIGVWNKALTTAEVAELYNNGNGLAYPFGGGVWNPGGLYAVSSLGKYAIWLGKYIIYVSQ